MSTDGSSPALMADDALRNAARLLGFAEDETDLAKMERLEKLADSWITVAALLVDRERV